jgi:hypothetical protein
MRSTVSVVGCLAAVLVCAPMSSAATLAATPLNFGAVFNSAQGGDTILLASGDYGRFPGGSKPSTVTIMPQSGATPVMDVDFNPASFIRLEGLTIRDLDIAGNTNNVTVANSRVTGGTVIRTEAMNGANVVLDRNTHADIDVCNGCYEGRITLPGKGPTPSGVTIRNSLFSGGNADGIQNGSRGTQIVGNEFVNIRESNGVHTDAIQLYGSSSTLVHGNWIHATSSGIRAPDGMDHEIIQHNVIQPGNHPFALEVGSDDGSIIRHNTLPDGACSFNLRCGIIAIGSKPSDDAGRGTIVKDNILGEVSVGGGNGAATIAEQDYNLIANGPLRGSHDLRGKPTYLGGSAPATFVGFELANGSLGSSNASDGTDRGAAIAPLNTPGSPPVTTPGAVAPGVTAPLAGPSVKLSVRRRVTWRQLRRGLRVRVTSPVRVRVAFRLAGKGAKRSILRRKRTMRAGTRNFLLKPRRARLGRRRARTLVLSVTVTDGAGAATRLQRTIRVRR